MPVYNGGQVIAAALDALLAQSFSDFELIISDNGSTDNTADICLSYAGRDSRIRYIRQEENIGVANNFLTVFQEARAEYFKWQSCDDLISSDFVEINIQFLRENSEYVASTSPNGFEGRPLEEQTLVDFSLEGDTFERFKHFFNHCWDSHGIFYCLMRREVLLSCTILQPGPLLFAQDWSIDLFLTSKGQINRTEAGSMTFGVAGLSRGDDAYKVFRTSPLETLIPFLHFSRYVLGLIANFPARQRLYVMGALLKLNLKANRDRFRGWKRAVKRKFSI